MKKDINNIVITSILCLGMGVTPVIQASTAIDPHIHDETQPKTSDDSGMNPVIGIGILIGTGVVIGTAGSIAVGTILSSGSAPAIAEMGVGHTVAMADIGVGHTVAMADIGVNHGWVEVGSDYFLQGNSLVVNTVESQSNVIISSSSVENVVGAESIGSVHSINLDSGSSGRILPNVVRPNVGVIPVQRVRVLNVARPNVGVIPGQQARVLSVSSSSSIYVASEAGMGAMGAGAVVGGVTAGGIAVGVGLGVLTVAAVAALGAATGAAAYYIKKEVF